MASEPVVSVVIPTYNRAHSIGQTIASVLDQTFTKFELLVVDDGSIDDTAAVVREIRDSRLRYIRLERNAGANAARNRGIAESRGEFVAFLDSDDRWHPTKLQKQLDVFARVPAEVGLVSTGLRTLTLGGVVRAVSIPQHRGYVFPVALALQPGLTRSSVILVRSRVLDQIGGWDEQLCSRQDWDLGIRICRVWAIDFVPEILVDVVAEGDNRISSNLSAFQRGLLAVEAKYRDDVRAQAPDVRAEVYRAYASHFWHCRLWRRTLEYVARSILDEPRYALRYGRGAARRVAMCVRLSRPTPQL